MQTVFPSTLYLITSDDHSIFHENVENPTAVFNISEHNPFVMLHVDIHKHVLHQIERREHLHAHLHYIGIVSQLFITVVAAFCQQHSK
jgi:hypothetical protein